MYIKEEEFSDRPIIEWLVIQLKQIHYDKYGERCEITHEHIEE
jgi:hypothetical protein